MRNIWTIAKKEFSQYFLSPIAYSVMFLLLVIVGIIFTIIFLQLSEGSFTGQEPTPPDSRPIASSLGFLLMLLLPALTMRLVADEVRMGTMELLLTAPLRDYELIVGKWLGAFLFVLVPVGITLIFPLMFHMMTEGGIDQLLLISNYLGLVLAVSAFLGMGVGISALFSNQIAALLSTLALFIIMWWLIGIPANFMQGAGNEIFKYLSLSEQFSGNFVRGTISLSSIIYFLSLTALGLVIGSTAVEIRRWR